MKTLIIFAHPWLGSYNGAILNAVQTGLTNGGHEYDTINLYQENFNPVLSEEELKSYSKGEFLDQKVGEYQQKINDADHIFFIFPIWWEVMPAVLKGFLDKLFIPGWSYDIGSTGMIHGKLKNKSATVITTMNSPKTFYNLIYSSPIKNSFIRGTLKLCGFKKVKWFELYRVLTIGDKKRKHWLQKIESYASKLKTPEEKAGIFKFPSKEEREHKKAA